jgi:hypothetical protein
MTAEEIVARVLYRDALIAGAGRSHAKVGRIEAREEGRGAHCATEARADALENSPHEQIS